MFAVETGGIAARPSEREGRVKSGREEQAKAQARKNSRGCSAIGWQLEAPEREVVERRKREEVDRLVNTGSRGQRRQVVQALEPEGPVRESYHGQACGPVG